MAPPSAVTFYHNPRCGKSRAALQLLRERGIEPHLVEYLKEPPSAAQLHAILDLLGTEPRAMMRTKEPLYKQLGLSDSGLDRDALLQAMATHPILIERPIVLANGKAAIGRPPENILEIL